MIEISLFGVLLGTLAYALLVVLVIVALTSVTYIAMTLITAIRARPGAAPLPAGVERGARLIGVLAAIVGGGIALAGLRVGSAGSGGELIPTLAVIIAGATALGSMTTCAVLASARGALTLKEARGAREALLQAATQAETRRLEEANQHRLEGGDLVDEERAARVALGRLRGALDQLATSRDEIAGKLDQDRIALGSDLRNSYKRAQDEVQMKLDLGKRILEAAEVATFRLACSAPLRKLVRRRPREALLGLERLDQGQGGAPEGDVSLEPVVLALSAFLGEIRDARRALQRLGERRPESIKANTDEDPLLLAQQDIDVLENAYQAVLERVEVVQVRREADASMEAVADAAGEVSSSVTGMPADQSELAELATEVTRAETAVAMATPAESDPEAITLALWRCTAALGRSDGASLDELLKALRSFV